MLKTYVVLSRLYEYKLYLINVRNTNIEAPLYTWGCMRNLEQINSTKACGGSTHHNMMGGWMTTVSHF